MGRLFPKWVLVWTLIAISVTSFPYLLGCLLTQPEMTFTGNLLNPTDTFSYFADMQLGFHGFWQFHMPYSAQSNRPIALFMMYIVLGHLARLSHLPIPLIYHIARVILGVVFALVSYRFLCRSLQTEQERKFAFGLLLFTGGLGWLMLMFFGLDSSQSLRPDLWIFDAISFGMLAGFPHFLLNATLMMGLLMACQNHLESPGFSSVLVGIITSLGIALIHPQQLAIVGTVAGFSVLLFTWENQRELIKRTLSLVLMFLPSLVLSALLTFQSVRDPFLANWLDQGNTFSPPVWSLLILYGPVLVFAIVGFGYILFTRKWEDRQVALWFIIVPFFLYIPVNYQRRFFEGWHVPVVILASLGWHQIISPWLGMRVGKMAIRMILGSTILTVCLTPILLLSIMTAKAYFIEPLDNVHLSKEESGAIAYLQSNADCDDVILSSVETGNLLPAYICLKSFAGHWSLTPFLNQRLTDIAEFYKSTTPDNKRVVLMDTFNIRYVYFGEAERNQGDFQPDQVDYLRLVYQNPKVAIYETTR